MTSDLSEEGDLNRKKTHRERDSTEKQINLLFNDLERMVEAYKVSSVDIAAGSDMYLDNLALKPYLMSTVVGWAINSCFDHLITIRDLRAKEMLPNIATYTLLRAAMEHASQAIWHLDQDEVKTRQRRVLLQAARSASVREKALNAVIVKTGIRYEGDLEEINEHLIKMNKTVDQDKMEVITTKEVRESGITIRVNEAGALLQRQSSGSKEVNVIGGHWRLASGIAHANAGFGLMLLSQKGQTYDHASKGTTVKVEITEAELLRLLQPSIHLLDVALQLDKYRRGADTNKYPTFSK